MKGTVAALTVLLLTAAGCSSRSEQETLSATEQRRLLVAPKVGRFLVDAQRAYERGTYEMALALSDSAERYAPDLADIHFLRGVVYTQLNQLHIARAAYDVVLELDPVYPGARYNMGLNAFRRGKLRDAITYYQAEREIAESSNLMLELGRAYAKLGEPDSARVAYEQALVLDSTNTTAYMWLGQLHEELGEFEQALTYSREGLRLRPDDLDYKYIIGSLLYRSGQIDEAVGYLEPVADARPWHHGAQFNLGQVLMRLDREDDAQRYFVQADSAQQMQQKINEAQQTINRDPQLLDNWVALGTLLRQSGQLDLAVEAFKVATSLQPRNLFLQSNLALVMMESGDTEAAIRRYRAILGLDSTLVEVWLNLGAAYANADRADEARAAWRQTLKYKPGHATARAYLAQLDNLSGTR